MCFSFPQLNIVKTLKRFPGNRRTWFAIFAVVVLALAASFYFFRKDYPEAEAGWWDEGWYYRRQLVVDSTKIDQDLTDFPVAVQFTSTGSNPYSNTNSDGSDLRFTDFQGNLLKYEIESWNESGTSTVWVKLPSVASSTDTNFFMYYGNPSAQNTETPTEIWDSNYVAVWHLSEVPGNGNTFYDSTSNNNDGVMTDANNNSTQVSGEAGKSVDFNGDADYINFGHGTSLNFGNAITLEAWAKHDNNTNHMSIVGKDSGSGTRISHLWILTSNKVEFGLWKNGVEVDASVGNNVVTTGAWNYIVGTYDGVTMNRYVNGSILSNPVALSSPFDTNASVDTIISIPSNYVFNGAIDEVRISKIARSSAWIKASYESILGTLLSDLGEEQGPGPVAYWSFDEGYGTTANDYSTGGNNGTITGATWKDSSECVKGKCLFFNDNGYVQMNTTTTLAKNNFTISAWFKTDSTADDKIISFGTSYHPLQILNGNFRVCMNGCSVGTRIFNDNIWHHALIVGDQSSIRVYVDGQLEITQGVTSGDMAGILRIGAVGADGGGTSPTYYFKGYIDEVKVYNYARSLDQIKQDYNKGFSIALGQADQYNSLSEGLVGYWPMDEASWNGTTGEVVDMSGNNTRGTATNANTTSTARFGRAGSFDGDSDYVELNNNSKIANLNSSSFTMAGWIRTTDITKEWQGIFGTDNSLSFFAIYLQSDVYAYTYMDGQVGNIRTLHSGANSIENNTWYHIAATRDYQTGVTNLYLDGKLVDTFTALGNAGDPQNGLYLSVDGANSFKGQLDDMRIYNRALSADEVRRLSEWAPGPLFYMPFDEGSGTSQVNDISGNGFVGTMNGAMTQNDWVHGKYGWALDFDGSNDYISTSTTAFDNNVNTVFTYETWFKTKQTTYGDILWGQFGCKGWNIQITATGVIRALLLTGSCVSYNLYEVNSGSFIYNDNKWHHVAAIYDRVNNNLSLYIDGIYLDSTTIDNVDAGNGGAIRIGANYNATTLFQGQIDEVKIYNYARNQRQILEDMNASRQNNPTAYWSFDEGQGSYANDYSGNNHRGTLGCSGTGCSLPEWKTGVRNSAIYSDPATSTEKQCVSLSTDNLSIASATGTPVSISVWLNASTTQIGGGWVIRRGSGADENYSMILVASGGKYKVKLEGYDGITFRNAVSNGAYITPDEWTHVVMIYKQGIGFDLYINGVFKETVSYPYINLTGSSFAIACGGGSNQSYNGYIDELKIYQYELTLDEIKKDFNFGQQNILSKPNSEFVSTTTSPVAWWKMDDMSGSSGVDSSGKGYTLNFSNMDSSNWSVEGKKGGSLTFNGIDENTSTGGFVDLGTSNHAFTISGWINPTVKDGVIVHVASTSTGSGWCTPFIGFSSSGYMAAQYWEGTSVSLYASTTFIQTGAWTHFTETYSPTAGGKFYINGRLVVSAPTKTTYTASGGSNYVFLGRNTNGAGSCSTGDINKTWYNGKLDDIKIWNYDLSPRQVALEYNGGAPVGYWNFDEGEGTTVYDRTGNSNNGSLFIGSGGTQTTTSTAWTNGASGKINGSLNFDGTDDKVNLGSVTTGENVSISSWIKTTNGNERPIFSNRGSGVYYGISGGKFFIYDNDASPVPNMNSNKTINDGNWHHVVWTSNGSSSVMYIDGELDSVLVQSRLSGSGTAYVAWDAANGTEYFPGQIDELKIWNYALTADEIKQEYNGGFSSFFR